MYLLALLRQLFIGLEVALSVAAHGSLALRNTVRVCTAVGTQWLARGVHVALPVQHLLKVLHAHVVFADVTLGAVLVVVAHGALVGAVLGLAVALAATTMEDGVAAVAVGARAAIGVERLAELVLAAGFLQKKQLKPNKSDWLLETLPYLRNIRISLDSPSPFCTTVQCRLRPSIGWVTWCTRCSPHPKNKISSGIVFRRRSHFCHTPHCTC